MPRRGSVHRFYIRRSLFPKPLRQPAADTPARPVLRCAQEHPAMLDVAFLVVGALFLGACVLYALACDHL
jgi:hypothetical protein